MIADEIHDPVYRFTTWHHLHSPYGELFTVITYPLAWLPLPVAYWVLKVITVLMSLAFIALVGICARLLGRDPRFALLFVAANPIFLMYAIPGFHNDFFMLVPSTAAVALLLARRDRSAGAMLMVAVAVKFTAGLLLPFLLLAARPSFRRVRIIEGAVLAGIPLLGLSLALFGLSLPNLSDQATLLTDWSIPNLFGLVIGIGGGTHGLLQAAQRSRRGHGRAAGSQPARLALGSGVGDAGADRQPGVAGALVRGLAAAAGGAQHERQVASGRARPDRVPRADVHAGDRTCSCSSTG